MISHIQLVVVYVRYVPLPITFTADHQRKGSHPSRQKWPFLKLNSFVLCVWITEWRFGSLRGLWRGRILSPLHCGRAGSRSAVRCTTDRGRVVTSGRSEEHSPLKRGRRLPVREHAQHVSEGEIISQNHLLFWTQSLSFCTWCFTSLPALSQTEEPVWEILSVFQSTAVNQRQKVTTLLHMQCNNSSVWLCNSFVIWNAFLNLLRPADEDVGVYIPLSDRYLQDCFVCDSMKEVCRLKDDNSSSSSLSAHMSGRYWQINTFPFVLTAYWLTDHRHVTSVCQCLSSLNVLAVNPVQVSDFKVKQHISWCYLVVMTDPGRVLWHGPKHQVTGLMSSNSPLSPWLLNHLDIKVAVQPPDFLLRTLSWNASSGFAEHFVLITGGCENGCCSADWPPTVRSQYTAQHQKPGPSQSKYVKNVWTSANLNSASQLPCVHWQDYIVTACADERMHLCFCALLTCVHEL